MTICQTCHRSSNIEFCQSEVRREHSRPCRVILNDEERRRRDCSRKRVEFQVLRPFCCFADCHQILIILASAALLYSVVALVLTCIYAPHPFFIPLLGYSIFTMLIVLAAVLTGYNVLLKIAFVLTSILAILTCVGAIYCVVHVIHNFYADFDWKWRFYIITMLVTQAIMIFYVVALICLISEIISYNRRFRAEKLRTQPIPTWRRY